MNPQPKVIKMFQTIRGYFYNYQKKVETDPKLYLNKDTSDAHIALLGDAVCLDRVSIGFVPKAMGQFTGPITIFREEAPVWRKTIDYVDEIAPVEKEWISVFNYAVPKRKIEARGGDLKGIALFEEECKFSSICKRSLFWKYLLAHLFVSKLRSTGTVGSSRGLATCLFTLLGGLLPMSVG